MSGSDDRLRNREIILEWLDYGDLIRVNAIDTATGVEASATGPRTADRNDLERFALRKLARRLFDAPDPDPQSNTPAAPRRGKLL